MKTYYLFLGNIYNGGIHSYITTKYNILIDIKYINFLAIYLKNHYMPDNLINHKFDISLCLSKLPIYHLLSLAFKNNIYWLLYDVHYETIDHKGYLGPSLFIEAIHNSSRYKKKNIDILLHYASNKDIIAGLNILLMRNGNYDIIKLLLSHIENNNIHTDYENLLMYANSLYWIEHILTSKNIDINKSLFDYGTNVTLLLVYIQRYYKDRDDLAFERIKLLLKYKADVNKHINNMYPLILSLNDKLISVELVKLLLEYGCKTDITNEDGDTIHVMLKYSNNTNQDKQTLDNLFILYTKNNYQ